MLLFVKCKDIFDVIFALLVNRRAIEPALAYKFACSRMVENFHRNEINALNYRFLVGH